MAQWNQNLIPLKDEKAFNCDADGYKQTEHLKQQVKPLIPEVLQKDFSKTLNSITDPNTLLLEQPFECKMCPMGVNCTNKLSHQLDVQSEWKPYICDICQKAFSEEKDLKEHLRTHARKRPFVCEICAKAFCQKAFLHEHLCVHTGEKPYVCEICQKAYKNKQSLKQHIPLHTKYNRFFV